LPTLGDRERSAYCWCAVVATRSECSSAASWSPPRRYVQGTTRAGGRSQQRFARRRANQARAAFAAAADTAAQVLLPEAHRLDAVICGGDRAAADKVLADPRLAVLAELRRDPFLFVPDPRLRVLQAAPEQFRAVHITLQP
jgi:hypothetical protein